MSGLELVLRTHLVNVETVTDIEAVLESKCGVNSSTLLAISAGVNIEIMTQKSSVVTSVHI